MGLQKREVMVPSATVALADGIGKFLVDAYGEVKDKEGFEAMDDLPGIGASFIANVLPSLANLSDVKAEMQNHSKEVKVALVLAVLESLGDLLEEKAKPKRKAKLSE